MNAGCLRMAVALWIVALVAGGHAESYPNRPTANEMNEIVDLGTACVLGVNERCQATQYSTNPASYYVNPPFVKTNYAGWYLNHDAMGTMAAKIRSLVPSYVKMVCDGTVNIVMLTEAGVWEDLEIGDHTSQFTATPATGTNPPAYGDSPWRIYVEDLVERHQVLNVMRWTSITPTTANRMICGATYGSYAEIANNWSFNSWSDGGWYNYPSAWVDTYGSGPWSVYKIRGKFQFVAPVCTSVVCGVQLYGVANKLIQGSINDFLDYESPGDENECFELDSFAAPLTPGHTYTDSRLFGDSSAIVPDPGSPPSDWTKGWILKGLGIVDWQFNYCMSQ